MIFSTKYRFTASVVISAAIVTAIFLPSACNSESENFSYEIGQLKQRLATAEMKISRIEERNISIEPKYSSAYKNSDSKLQQALRRDAKQAPTSSEENQLLPQESLAAISPASLSKEYLSDSATSTGSSNSHYAVVLFSDFQCSTCRQFYDNVLTKLLQQDLNNKAIVFFSKHYPLVSSPNGLLAANASLCAAEQNLYWDSFKWLYSNPDKVDSGEFITLLPLKLSLEEERFSNCSSSGRYHRRISQDVEIATKIGVSGAPSLFIGEIGGDADVYTGVLIRGAQPYDVIRRQLMFVVNSGGSTV